MTDQDFAELRSDIKLLLSEVAEVKREQAEMKRDLAEVKSNSQGMRLYEARASITAEDVVALRADVKGLNKRLSLLEGGGAAVAV